MVAMKAQMQLALVAAYGEGGSVYQDGATGDWFATADDMDAPTLVAPEVLRCLILAGYLAPSGPKSYILTYQGKGVVELLKGNSTSESTG